MVKKVLKEENCGNYRGELNKCDKELRNFETTGVVIEHLISIFTSCVSNACNSAFQKLSGRCRVLKHKSVPWWTTELTILRKRVLALRRRFQRTRNNENLRLERKLQYQEGNRTYQNNLQQAKLESWKLFCSQTNENNPWNVAYKIAAGKLHNKTHLATLQTSVGEYTTDTTNTINHMLEHFVPEDLVTDDSEHHKAIRKYMTEPIDTEDAYNSP